MKPPGFLLLLLILVSLNPPCFAQVSKPDFDNTPCCGFGVSEIFTNVINDSNLDPLSIHATTIYDITELPYVTEYPNLTSVSIQVPIVDCTLNSISGSNLIDLNIITDNFRCDSLNISLKNLKCFSLYFAKVSVPPNFLFCDHLVSLNLCFNKTFDISGLSRISNMQSLVINFESLDSLPSSLGQLNTLEILNLSVDKHRLRRFQLPPSYFNLQSLVYLRVPVDLSSFLNSDSKFQNLKELQVLKYKGKYFKKLESLSYLENLHIEGISWNKLRKMRSSLPNVNILKGFFEYIS